MSYIYKKYKYDNDFSKEINQVWKKSSDSTYFIINDIIDDYVQIKSLDAYASGKTDKLCLLSINDFNEQFTFISRNFIAKEFYTKPLSDEELFVKFEVVSFFHHLCDRFKTYFLSDYVSEYGEFDSNLISKEEHKNIVLQRDLLRKDCEQLSMDMHQISCEVATHFLTYNQH